MDCRHEDFYLPDFDFWWATCSLYTGEREDCFLLLLKVEEMLKLVEVKASRKLSYLQSLLRNILVTTVSNSCLDDVNGHRVEPCDFRRKLAANLSYSSSGTSGTRQVLLADLERREGSCCMSCFAGTSALDQLTVYLKFNELLWFLILLGSGGAFRKKIFTMIMRLWCCGAQRPSMMKISKQYLHYLYLAKHCQAHQVWEEASPPPVSYL